MLTDCLKKALPAVLAVIAMLAVVGGVQAGTLQLGNSGWSASWASDRDQSLSLNVDFETPDSVFIEKLAQFSVADLNPAGFVDPIVIVFQQTSSNAKPFIAINDEQIVNNTGVVWDGFRMTILGGPGVAFDVIRTDIAPPGSGFSISPFRTHTYVNNDTDLYVSDGFIGAGSGSENIWYPGGQSGALVINGKPFQEGLRSFSFKEQPQINVIPLPPAALSGLSGLAAMSLVLCGKRLGRLFS